MLSEHDEHPRLTPGDGIKGCRSPTRILLTCYRNMVDYTIVFKVGVYSRSHVDLLHGGRVTLNLIFQLVCRVTRVAT